MANELKPVEGLETKGYMRPEDRDQLSFWVSKNQNAYYREAVVARSQAEAIIVAKNATLQDAIACVKVLTDDKNKLEADNAALTARAKELEEGYKGTFDACTVNLDGGDYKAFAIGKEDGISYTLGIYNQGDRVFIKDGVIDAKDLVILHKSKYETLETQLAAARKAINTPIEAVDFLYKHGDLTYGAAKQAIDLLVSNGFYVGKRAALEGQP